MNAPQVFQGTRAEVSVPASSSERDRFFGCSPRRPVVTCHPSATGGSPGRAVSVAAGDVEGVEIRMPRHAAITISGSVLDASGAPARGVQVWLTQMWRGSGGGIGSPPLAEDGAFRISDVTPGKYALRAVTGGSEANRSPDFEWAVMELDVTTTDIDGLLLALSPAARVKGRVLFEDGPPEAAASIQVGADPAASLSSFRQQPVSLEAGHRFELAGLAGPSTIFVSPLPPRWVVKSIRYRGADITSVATEFRTGSDEIEVLLTSRIALVRGRVLGPGGEPVAAARVVITPADPAKWPVRGMRSSVAARPDGSFGLPPHAAGDYLVFAISPDEYDASAQIPYAVIERIAERISLQDHDQRAIDVRLTSITAVR